VPADLSPANSWATDNKVPAASQKVLQDDRCEAFIWPVKKDADPSDLAAQQYFAFEINRTGGAVRSKSQFFRKFDFSWSGPFEQAVVPHSNSTKEGFVFKVALTGDLLLKDIDHVRLGLYRGTRIGSTADSPFAWASWVDPGDAKVDFHRPETFGKLVFA